MKRLIIALAKIVSLFFHLRYQSSYLIVAVVGVFFSFVLCLFKSGFDSNMLLVNLKSQLYRNVVYHLIDHSVGNK